MGLFEGNKIGRIIMTVLLTLTLQAAVSAEAERDSMVVQKVYDLSQDLAGDKIAPVRGGTKDKPLGCYIGSKEDMQFRSGYKDVDPRTQCEWAYDLHEYVVKNGGGWDNYQKYVREMPQQTTLLNQSLGAFGGGKDTHDPMDKAHVPYDKQAAFADKWWKDSSQAYSSSIVPPKDWWIHDAVVDGNNLWTRYEQFSGKGSADFVMWRDAELAQLLNKK